LNEITESQWLEICGLITLSREYRKLNEQIEPIIETKFSFIDGYFTDEVYEDYSLNKTRKNGLNYSCEEITKERDMYKRSYEESEKCLIERGVENKELLFKIQEEALFGMKQVD